MKFMRIIKGTSLIISVMFLLIFNIIFASFVSCCETKEELFLNNDEHACCTCCNKTVDKTLITNHASVKTQTTVDDCDSCVCITYASTSASYFVFTKRTILPFHFSPIAPDATFVETMVTAEHHSSSPTIVYQKTECLSTVVLLM